MIKERPITFIVLTYWFLFWFLNGLDKIMPGQSMGMLRWWGNNRVEKFTMYFDRLAIDPAAVKPVLMFAFVVEMAVAGIFIWAALKLLRRKPGAVRMTDKAIVASIAVFAGFAIFDVIVGDRAELLEHSTYVGVLLISYLAVAMEVYFHHLREATRALLAEDDDAQAYPAPSRNKASTSLPDMLRPNPVKSPESSMA